MGSAVGKNALIVLLAGLLLAVRSATCDKGSPTSSNPPKKSPSVPNPPAPSPAPPPLTPAPPPQYCPAPSSLPSPPRGALTFKGVVSSGSKGLSDICVYLSWDASDSTGTTAKGEFQFSGIAGSRFIITPSLEGHAFSPSNFQLGTQSRDDLDFTVGPASYGTEIGAIAADFSAKNQVGQYTSLYQYFGQVVLINFSADWCVPCREEAGHLEKLFQDYKVRGFHIITLLSEGDLAPWASEYQLTFPVIKEPGGLGTYYGAAWIPLNIILDRNMTIRYKEFDYDEAAIIDTLKKYL